MDLKSKIILIAGPTASGKSNFSLKLAKNFTDNNNLKNIDFVNADIFDDVLVDNYFDFIWCNGVLHHTKDPKLAFDILSKGGNISAVFRHELPDTYKSYKVINADESDLRFTDNVNVICGLKAKGKAIKDYSGFVLG